MAGSLHDSQLYSKLFPTGEIGRLFSDSAELRAMLLVEGTLAKVQGAAGVIPELSGTFIHRAALELPLDPGGMAAATGQNGVPVPALVAAFRAAMQAPEHAQYLHWGATSQDIMDTALMLRLRQVLALIDTGLGGLLTDLANLAETHADLPMAGRTYGQLAAPVSFGAVVAQWGWPLLDLRGELANIRADGLLVSLSGAAGTGSKLGPDPAALRRALAEALGLRDPGRSWHADRGPVLRIAAWLARLAAALGKIGEDLILAVQSGIGEVALAAVGASSTMPQKQNPVAASVLVALAHQVAALNGALLLAGSPRQQRDGADWFTEWLSLPGLVLASASALETARALVPGIVPIPVAMAAALTASRGMIHAEALSFRLAAHMPRPEAQAAVKQACQNAMSQGRHLAEVAAETWPEIDTDDVFDPARQMGSAPAEARAFVAQARGHG
ncbi:lyase family protein [Pseudooceanicola sp.]|uniref:lyase family protein n=1 Tax=Pseudooceanicola sp. TaxID=1914328 RepID=UPI00262FADF3|nr:lyase family protein [Pseudooceanicola sp.]MDF1855951.1 lyase family protein [Pseudooceanicola sp.]